MVFLNFKSDSNCINKNLKINNLFLITINILFLYNILTNKYFIFYFNLNINIFIISIYILEF